MKHLLPAVLLLLANAQALAQSSAPASAPKAVQAAKSAAAAQPASTKIETAEKAPPPASGAAATDAKGEAPEGLRLTPTGRRDPFRPITLNVRTATRRRENLSPLERFDIGQLRLVGIVWNIKEPTALVEDSSGLGYTVKVGTPIGANDGKVKEVRRDGLIIEEFFVDLYGAQKKREVSMRLPVEQ